MILRVCIELIFILQCVYATIPDLSESSPLRTPFNGTKKFDTPPCESPGFAAGISPSLCGSSSFTRSCHGKESPPPLKLSISFCTSPPISHLVLYEAITTGHITTIIQELSKPDVNVNVLYDREGSLTSFPGCMGKYIIYQYSKLSPLGYLMVCAPTIPVALAFGDEKMPVRRSSVTSLRYQVKEPASILECLLRYGADINAPVNELGDTALMLSILSGSPDRLGEATIRLLERGASLLTTNKSGCSAWSMLVTLGYTRDNKVDGIPYSYRDVNAHRVDEAARYLPKDTKGNVGIDAPLIGVNATVWNSFRFSDSHEERMRCFVKMLREWLNHPSFRLCHDFLQTLGVDSTEFATCNEKTQYAKIVNIVRWLDQLSIAKDEKNVLLRLDTFMKQPREKAIAFDEFDPVKRYRAILHAPSPYIVRQIPLPTALAYAVDHSDEFMVRILHKHGANLNVSMEGNRTPFTMACTRSLRAMARLLIELGAEVNVWSGEYAPDELSNAFRVAVDLNNTVRIREHLIRILHQKSPQWAHPNIPSRIGLGRTFLMQALLDKDMAMARLLVALGADIYATDATDKTAIFYAQSRGIANDDWMPQQVSTR